MIRSYLVFVLMFSSFVTCATRSQSYAQEKSMRSDKIYFRSGFGFSAPIAESRHFLDAKFSTSLGGLVFLGDQNFFFYPKIGLNAYGYDQLTLDAGAENRVIHSRSTTYLLSLDLGYRKAIKRFGVYGFGGGGGGIILLPKISAPESEVISMYNSSNFVALVEAGLGADYSFGNVFLFAEASYTHGLNRLEEQRYRAVPLSLGVRTNVTKIFYKN